MCPARYWPELVRDFVKYSAGHMPAATPIETRLLTGSAFHIWLLDLGEPVNVSLGFNLIIDII